jgi:putative inorganic carbon (HCO3(-)) transporter
MFSKPEAVVFVLTMAGAAAVLISIAAAETLLSSALAVWVIWGPRRIEVPRYFLPLIALAAVTAISVATSPEPHIGWFVRKTTLFAMGLLACTFVNTAVRARTALATLLGVAVLGSAVALFQFGMAYLRFRSTHQLIDDPTVLARVTGFMGHWMTFSGEQLLVWCAAIPALLSLGRRWIGPVGLVTTALVLTFTRSVWLGAVAGLAVVFLILPRRVLIPVLVPAVLIGGITSGLIYHRVALSFGEERFAPDFGRIELWKAGVQMIRHHPLFGVGPERISTEFPKYYTGEDLQSFFHGHLENDFLQIAAERGLLCFGIFLWFLLELYAGLVRRLKIADAASRWTVLSAIAALTGFIVSGLFEYNFGDSEVLLLFLFIVSVPYGVIQKERVPEVRSQEAEAQV